MRSGRVRARRRRQEAVDAPAQRPRAGNGVPAGVAAQPGDHVPQHGGGRGHALDVLTEERRGRPLGHGPPHRLRVRRRATRRRTGGRAAPADELVLHRLQQRSDEMPIDGQHGAERPRGQPRRRERDGHQHRPRQAGRHGAFGHQLAERQHLRAADVEGRVDRARQGEAGGEVVEHIVDGDGLGVVPGAIGQHEHRAGPGQRRGSSRSSPSPPRPRSRPAGRPSAPGLPAGSRPPRAATPDAPSSAGLRRLQATEVHDPARVACGLGESLGGRDGRVRRSPGRPSRGPGRTRRRRPRTRRHRRRVGHVAAQRFHPARPGPPAELGRGSGRGSARRARRRGAGGRAGSRCSRWPR